MSLLISERDEKAGQAADDGDAPVNQEGDHRKGHELQDSGHHHGGELIGIAGAGCVIADGIGKTPATFLGIEAPACIEDGLDEPAPQIDGDAGPGDSGIGKGAEHDNRLQHEKGHDDDQKIGQVGCIFPLIQ